MQFAGTAAKATVPEPWGTAPIENDPSARVTSVVRVEPPAGVTATAIAGSPAPKELRTLPLTVPVFGAVAPLSPPPPQAKTKAQPSAALARRQNIGALSAVTSVRDFSIVGPDE